jgi:hypothetical protein
MYLFFTGNTFFFMVNAVVSSDSQEMTQMPVTGRRCKLPTLN